MHHGPARGEVLAAPSGGSFLYTILCGRAPSDPERDSRRRGRWAPGRRLPAVLARSAARRASCTRAGRRGRDQLGRPGRVRSRISPARRLQRLQPARAVPAKRRGSHASRRSWSPGSAEEQARPRRGDHQRDQPPTANRSPRRPQRRPRLVFLGTHPSPGTRPDKIMRLATALPEFDFEIVGASGAGTASRRTCGARFSTSGVRARSWPHPASARGRLALHRIGRCPRRPAKVREYLLRGMPVDRRLRGSRSRRRAVVRAAAAQHRGNVREPSGDSGLRALGRRKTRRLESEVRDRIDVLVKERERLEFLDDRSLDRNGLGQRSQRTACGGEPVTNRRTRRPTGASARLPHPDANTVTADSPTLRRILVVHSRYLSGHASGENRVVDDEIELLREAGYDVRTVVRQVEPDRSRVALAGAIVWGRAGDGELDATIRAHRPDVVHFHNLFPAVSPAPLRTARRAGIPVVVTLHNFRFICLAGTFLRDAKICEDCLGHHPVRGVLHGCYRGSRAESAALASSLSLHRLLRTLAGVTLFLAPVGVRPDEAHCRGLPAGCDPGPTELRRRGPSPDDVGRVLPLSGKALAGEGAADAARSLAEGRSAHGRRRRARAGSTGAGRAGGGGVPGSTRSGGCAPSARRGARARRALRELRRVAAGDPGSVRRRRPRPRERYRRPPRARPRRRQRPPRTAGRSPCLAGGRPPLARPRRVAAARRRRAGVVAGRLQPRSGAREPRRCLHRGDQDAHESAFSRVVRSDATGFSPIFQSGAGAGCRTRALPTRDPRGARRATRVFRTAPKTS